MTQKFHHANLITGGDKREREKKAYEICQDLLEITQALPRNPNFKVVLPEEGTTKIGIEKIRDLKMVVALKPTKGQKSVVFIPEAQKLTLEAQNSLLKVLEEPPKNCLFILSAPHRDYLLATIVSRCAETKLPPVVDFGDQYPQTEEISQEFSVLLKSRAGARLDWVAENLERINDVAKLSNMLNIWLSVLRDIQLTKLALEKLTINRKLAADLRNSAEVIEETAWLAALQKVKETKVQIETTNVDKRLCIEVLLLNLPEPSQ